MEATVLGIVGPDGIGILLHASINQFQWREVSLILLAVFGVVVISERIPPRIPYASLRITSQHPPLSGPTLLIIPFSFNFFISYLTALSETASARGAGVVC